MAGAGVGCVVDDGTAYIDGEAPDVFDGTAGDAITVGGAYFDEQESVVMAVDDFVANEAVVVGAVS